MNPWLEQTEMMHYDEPYHARGELHAQHVARRPSDSD